MSARSDANTDQVVYSGADIPSTTGGISFCAWVKVNTDNNQNQTIARLSAGGTIITFATDSDGLGGPGFFTTGNSTVNPLGFSAVETWRFVGFTADSDDAITYAGIESGTLTTSSTTGIGGAGVAARLSLFGRGNGDLTEWLPGSIANARVWFGVRLSEAEFEAERLSFSAVHTAGIFADWPLDGDLLDISGNGRHLTAGSTPLTLDSDPPITSVITGNGSVTASNATVSGSGSVLVQGSGDVQASNTDVVGTGAVIVSGSGNAQASNASVAGSGVAIITGNGAVSASPSVVDGAGTVPVIGNGSLIAAASIVAGMGAVIIHGNGSVVAPNAIVSGQDAIYEIPSAKRSKTTVLANSPIVAVRENRVTTTVGD